MKQKDYGTVLSIVGTSLMAFLLVLIYMSLVDMGKQLDRMNGKLSSMEKEFSNLQQKQTPGDKSEKKEKEPSDPQPSPESASAHVWLNQGRPFPLEEDPYFKSLPSSRGSANQTLIYWVNADEKGFNRLLENSAKISELYSFYVSSTLAQRHWQDVSKWSPQLAVRVEVSEDNREFTIYLRKNVRWHPAKADWTDPRYDWLRKDHYVTSEDFYFTYATIMNLKVNAAVFRPYYEDIETFSIVNEHVFTIRWKKSLYTNIPYTLEQFPMAKFIYSKDRNGNELQGEEFAKNFNNHWYNDRVMGCGPYIFSEHKPDEYYELIRNEFYYGYKPPIHRVRFVIVKDSNTAYMKLRGKEINVVENLSESIYQTDIYEPNSESYFHQKKLVYEIYPRMAYYHIKWSNTHPIFRDKMVRRAMSHAFDREGILNKVYMGLGVFCNGPVSADSVYYNKKIVPYEFSLEKARKILEDSGWQDRDGDGILEKNIDGKMTKFEFALYYFGSFAPFRQMYSDYREKLLKIGVEMKPQGVDWPVLQKKYEDKDFAAAHGVWLTSIPLDFYQIWHSQFANVPKSSNSIRYKNAEVDEICKKMREASDIDERIRLAYRMQEILHDEQPYTFLFFRSAVAAYTPNVKNRFIRGLRPHVLTHPYYME